jgi:transcriptional regulator with XRE-family HTH domain
MEIFAKRLLELRKEKGLSQASLAKQLNVSYSLICYWETNRAEPTAINIVKIANYFSVSADYLLGRTDF